MAKLGSIIKCKHCGRRFEKKISSEKYCSRECYKEVRAIQLAEFNYQQNEKKSKKTVVHERKCIVCGKSFTTKRARNFCCSGKCEYERRKDRTKHTEEIVYTPPKLVCVICGEEFEKTYARQICCSPECSKKRHNELTKSYRKEANEKAVKKKKPKPKPLSVVFAEMKEAGYEPHQYGKYMAELYLQQNH